MHVQAAVFLQHRRFQHAVIQQALDEGDGAQLTDQGGVEADLVNALLDLARTLRHARPLDRVQRNEQDIGRRTRIDQRKDAGIAHIAAVPIGVTINLHRLEGLRKAGGGEHGIERHLFACKDFHMAGFHIRRAEEQLQAGGPNGFEIDCAFHGIAERIQPQRVQVIRARPAL